MGLLFESMKKVQLHQEMKRKFLLERLHEKKITHSQFGTPLEMCDYDELKYELVLQTFREIDAEKDANSWF